MNKRFVLNLLSVLKGDCVNIAGTRLCQTHVCTSNKGKFKGFKNVATSWLYLTKNTKRLRDLKFSNVHLYKL